MKEGGGGGRWAGGVAETHLREGLWSGEVERRGGAFEVSSARGVRKAWVIAFVGRRGERV